MNNPLARSGSAIISHARLLKQWSRDLLQLKPEDSITVSELSCALPDCPPRETVIVILAISGTTRQLSIHKALLAVDHDDIVRAISANSA